MGTTLMPRFDVYEHMAVPLVMDVQADLLADLKTRVVIPLLPLAQAKKELLPRLKPVVKVNGKSYVLITTDISVLAVSQLGKLVGNAEDQRQVITEAVDFLLQGF
jgi:toxin CcdB